MKRGICTLALVTPFALATAALAQPAIDLDLGVISNPQVVTGTVVGITPGTVKWVRFEIPSMTRAAGQFLDITTNGGTLTDTVPRVGDSHIGLFNSVGAPIANNDDSGPGFYSQLSFGDTSPARAAVPETGNAIGLGLGGTRTGTNGADLPAGVYYLAVTNFGGNSYAAGWTVGTTHNGTGDVAVRLELGTDLGIVPLSATSGVGTTGCAGASRLMTVTVTPGTVPASTGISVVANLSAAGGSASQAFFDDATNGDVTAGDNIFSYAFTPPAAGAFAGTSFTVTDAQARSFNGNFATMTVNNCHTGTPASFIDLGTLSYNFTPITNEQSYTPGEIQWYRFEIAGANDPTDFLDVWTSAGAVPGTVGDTEIGLYDSTGALMDSDDDDGIAAYSLLSYGMTSPTRPAVGSSAIFSGQDGALAAGVYWLAVSEFSTTYGATNWSVTVGPADSGDIVTNIVYAANNAPTNPAGVGSGGSVAACGGSVLATVAVTGGINPNSTGLAVTLDTAALGGGVVPMFDNGTNGDVTSGDNIFSLNVAVAGGADASFVLPFAITDAEARNGAGDLNITRGTDLGELPNSAKQYYGSIPPATTLASSLSSNADSDMFAICVTDTANFGANVVGGAAFDTQLFLFNADGTGAAMNDDEPGAGAALQSNLQINLGVPPIVLASGGLHYLAISGYDRDPITSGNIADTIWADQGGTPAAFDAVWAPNGTTPTAPIVGWSGTANNAGGDYTITLTGAATVCPADLANSGGAGPDCAVDINDLLFFLQAFEAGVADVADSSGNGNQDCATDINDLLFFLLRFEAGC